MYMVQCPKLLTEKLLYIKGPMKVISGLLPETWVYCRSRVAGGGAYYKCNFFI
jgi:hypothetical protein